MSSAGLIRSLLAGLAGLVGYGGWAWYANLDHGAAIAMRSGLVQGGYSLVLTFLMTLVTEALYSNWQHVAGGVIWTTTVVSAILFSSAFTIHLLVGTPEILMTITPGFFIGTIYTYFYVQGLRAVNNAKASVAT
jgi:hypothetical protein